MKNFDEFTRKYPVSKTLRCEAVPQGKTLENIKRMGYIAADRQLEEDYSKAKPIIDRMYQAFIDSSLQDFCTDWNPLYEAVVACRKDRSPDNLNALKKIQEQYRTMIADKFSNQDLFKDLFGKKLFSGFVADRLPGFVLTEEEKGLLGKFNGFTTYFQNFFKKRKQLFSNEEKHSAISYRLINENFPRFVSNCEALKIIGETAPELLEKLRNAGSLQIYEGYVLEEIFSADFYNLLLRQRQIDMFNQLIGGIADEPGKVNVQGLNQVINLVLQSDKSLEHAGFPHGFSILYKQLLGAKTTMSFVPNELMDDEEVLSSVRNFISELESGQILRNVRRLFNGLEAKEDTTHIYIKNTKLSSFSSVVYGKWNICHDALLVWKKGSEKNITKKKIAEIEKWLKNSDITIAEIQSAFGEDDQAPVRKINGKVQALADDLHARLSSGVPERLKTPGEKESLKALLDVVMELYHTLQLFDVGEDNEKDVDFYSSFEKIMGSLRPGVPLYNQVRNYVTKKPYSLTKFKLNFGNSQLGSGWHENEIENKCTVLFLKDGQYYLGVLNNKNKPDLKKAPLPAAGEACYRRVVYMQMKDIKMSLPHSTISKKCVKAHFSASDEDYVLEGDKFVKPLVITREIYDLGSVKFSNDENNKKYKKIDAQYLKNTGDKEGYIKALHTWIDFVKDFFASYKSALVYDTSSLLPTEQYDNLLDFYLDVNQNVYNISFCDIPEKTVDRFVEEGKLFLFRLYNKDFAAGATGKPNLHTLYWKALFDPKNLSDVVVKLNGDAELFYRSKSDMHVFRHQVGEKMVNRTLKNGLPLPSDLHEEIYRYVNGTLNKNLSEEARSVLHLAVVRDVRYEIVKDRRFTEDKFFFHASVKLNYKCQKYSGLNEDVKDYLKEHPETYIIGIDRGERNLIYIVVTDSKGKIVEQKSLNVINCFDYWGKLDQREKERVEARQAWAAVGKIKDLKEGYLSLVINEITRMMIKYKAVVILENLDLGFKRIRSGISEKAVYQRFEKMLANKLGYLVFKDRVGDEPGSVLNAYQLADSTKTLEKTGSQNGFLFYIPAAFTSRVDPATGFFDFYDWGKIKTAADKKNFIAGFSSVRYERSTGDFIVHVGAENLTARRMAEDVRAEWDIVIEANAPKKGVDGNSYISGKRIRYRPGEQGRGQYENHLPCKELIRVLQQYGIRYETGKDILPAILQQDDAKLTDAFFDVFRLALQMRNTSAETGEDYFNSAVRDYSGRCFDSRRAEPEMPLEADANDAYHIALKGLFVLEKLRKGENIGIKNTEWLRYVQQRHS